MDIATTRPTRPRGPSWWKFYFMISDERDNILFMVYLFYHFSLILLLFCLCPITCICPISFCCYYILYFYHLSPFFFITWLYLVHTFIPLQTSKSQKEEEATVIIDFTAQEPPQGVVSTDNCNQWTHNNNPL